MEAANSYAVKEIHLEIGRILDFPLFKNSPILSRFLEYIVDETLQGRADQIKEYNIAINVLNRPQNFNSHDDAIVRIHAGRLRRSLAEYYQTDGKNNPILIDIPKGRYMPQFSAWDEKEKSILPPVNHIVKNPMVAIFPFKTISQQECDAQFVSALCEELGAELSRFENISVIGYYPESIVESLNNNILEAGRIVGADYIVSGSIGCREKQLLIRVNLIVAASGELIMTKSFEAEQDCCYEAMNEIISKTVTGIGGYYGVIFQDSASKSTGSNLQQSIFKYHQYHRCYSVQNYTDALSALTQSAESYPENAIVNAMLGELWLDGILLGLHDLDSGLKQGFYYSNRAIMINPVSQHAQYANAWACLFKGNKEECLSAVRKCVALNPSCSTIVAGAGFILVCAGYFDEGFEIMQKATEANPYYYWRVNCGFCFYYLYKNKYASANYWADKINAEETFWDPLLKAISLSYSGKRDESRKCFLKVLEHDPEIVKKMHTLFKSFILSEELINKFTFLYMRPSLLNPGRT